MKVSLQYHTNTQQKCEKGVVTSNKHNLCKLSIACDELYSAVVSPYTHIYLE